MPKAIIIDHSIIIEQGMRIICDSFRGKMHRHVIVVLRVWQGKAFLLGL